MADESEESDYFSEVSDIIYLLIDIPTRVSRRTLPLIDLVFVDSHDLVEEYGILPEIADHAGVLLRKEKDQKTIQKNNPSW